MALERGWSQEVDATGPPLLFLRMTQRCLIRVIHAFISWMKIVVLSGPPLAVSAEVSIPCEADFFLGLISPHCRVGRGGRWNSEDWKV